MGRWRKRRAMQEALRFRDQTANLWKNINGEHGAQKQRAEKAEAEVERLRERVDALLGLLGTARDVIRDHVGASHTVLLDALDATLAPEAKKETP